MLERAGVDPLLLSQCYPAQPFTLGVWLCSHPNRPGGTVTVLDPTCASVVTVGANRETGQKRSTGSKEVGRKGERNLAGVTPTCARWLRRRAACTTLGSAPARARLKIIEAQQRNLPNQTGACKRNRSTAGRLARPPGASTQVVGVHRRGRRAGLVPGAGLLVIGNGRGHRELQGRGVGGL